MGILEGLITVNRSRCDRWHSPDTDLLIQRAGKELADVVIYSALNAHEIGIDLIAAISDKFNEVSIKEGFPERLGRSGQYIV